MKPRILTSLIAIALAIALVAGGFTLAWFADEDTPATSPSFATGTVDFEIIEPEPAPEPMEWTIGGEDSCKDFTWTIQNIGSKRVFYRAELIETIETVVGSETAWGEGTRFRDPGNWATYFTYHGSPVEVELIAGKHHHAGWVRVGEDSEGFYVKYETIGGWKISETHLEVKSSLNDIPNNPGGPIPGRFTYKDKHAFVTTYTYRPQINITETMYIAAHAVVASSTQTAAVDDVEWTLTDGAGTIWTYNPDDNWWYYCQQPVMPGEEITLNLTACLNEDAGVGAYSVKLQAEAVQGTHGAINEEWPNNPCRLQ